MNDEPSIQLSDMPWRIECRKIKPKRTKKTGVTPSNLMCVMCGRNFQLYYSLKSHIRMEHKDVSVYTCYRCQAQFSNLNCLKLHVFGHDKNKKLFTWQCKYCKWKVPSSEALDRHIMRKHKPKKEPRKDWNFSCFKCERKFLTYRGLLKHTKMKHNSIPSDSLKFKCKTCQKVFKPGKQCHSEIHTSRDNYKTGNHANPTGCKRCIIDYLSLINIASHKHGGETSENRILIECQKCFEEIDGFAKLCGHRHEGELYRCLLCGETVQSNEHLAEHTRAHMKMTHLTCKVCYKTLETPALLFRHSGRHVDTIYKPFICGICLQSFGSTKSIRSHIQEHAEKGESVNNYNKCSELELKVLDQGDALATYEYSKSKCKSVVNEPETGGNLDKQSLENALPTDRNDVNDVKSECIITDESHEFKRKCKSIVQSVTMKQRGLNTLNVDHKRKRKLSKDSEEKCNLIDQTVITYKVGRNRKGALSAHCDSQISVNCSKRKKKTVRQSKIKVVKGRKGSVNWKFTRKSKPVSRQSMPDEYITEYTLISVDKQSSDNADSDKCPPVASDAERKDMKNSKANYGGSDKEGTENICCGTKRAEKHIKASKRTATRRKQEGAAGNTDCQIIDLTGTDSLSSTRIMETKSRLSKSRHFKNNNRKCSASKFGDSHKEEMGNIRSGTKGKKKRSMKASNLTVTNRKGEEGTDCADYQIIDLTGIDLSSTQSVKTKSTLSGIRLAKPKNRKLSTRKDSCIKLSSAYDNIDRTKENGVKKQVKDTQTNSSELGVETIDLTEEECLTGVVMNEGTIDLTDE